MTEARRFLVGINYWPRETAMFWWRRFDLAIVERDFSLIADYGFEVVRIFLLWGDFQPEMRRVSVAALDRLVQVAEAADACKLRILPTFFTGHMSGLNWLPSWMVQAGSRPGGFGVFSEGERRWIGIRNPYTDREVWRAQRRFIHEVTVALQGHPSVWGWDLGNEPSNLSLPPSRDACRGWLEEMIVELKRYDEEIPVTVGLHQGDLEEDRVLGPREAAQFCDLLSMHAYPCYAQWADGPLDALVPLFLGILTRWLGGREVLLTELGVPTEPAGEALPESDRERLGAVDLVPEDRAAQYYEEAMKRLAMNGFPGALAWCFADYDSALWSLPPLDERVHERYFGLFRRDGSPKEPAKVISRLGRELGEGIIHREWIDIEPQAYYERPLAHLKRLYRRFRDLLGSGPER